MGTWSVAGDTTMTTIGDLIDGTNYTVSVTAINCAGSSNSSSVSVQTCEWCGVCVCVCVCVCGHAINQISVQCPVLQLVSM